MGLLHVLAGSGALALVGIGLAMARFDEFKVARALFWAAGLVAGSADFWWQLTTSDPGIVRALCGIVVGIAVFVLLPMLLRWLNRLEAKAGALTASTLPEG
jgi:uncharacterized membrane protein